MKKSTIKKYIDKIHTLTQCLQQYEFFFLSMLFGVCFMVVGAIVDFSPLGYVGNGIWLSLPLLYLSLSFSEKILLLLYKKSKLKSGENK
jgi:hypothetical protein